MLKKKAESSFKKQVRTYGSTSSCNPKDLNLLRHFRENQISQYAILAVEACVCSLRHAVDYCALILLLILRGGKKQVCCGFVVYYL